MSPHVDGNPFNKSEFECSYGEQCTLQFRLELTELCWVFVIQEKSGAENAVLCGVSAHDSLAVIALWASALGRIGTIGEYAPIGHEGLQSV